MFEGTARDRILKELVDQQQSAGNLLNLSITRQGQWGPEFVTGNRFAFDLTTSKSWSQKAYDYGAVFDIVLPLWYR